MSYIGGLYTGIKYYAGLVNNITQVAQLDAYLADLVSKRKEDSVVAVFMMPYPFYSDGISPAIHRVEVPRLNSIMGYVPRNNKLLQEPYMWLSVDTGNEANSYRWESGSEPGNLSFILSCGMSPNPEIVCYPYNYNGVGGHNPTESVTCSGFPQCAFTIDSFRAWLAQKATGQALQLVGSAAAVVAGAAAAPVTGGASLAASAAGVAGLVGMASSVNNIVKDATQGNKVRGTQGGTTDVAVREKSILFKYMCVNENSARVIDDFFTRYGYSCCRVKIPNRNVRKQFTFTKTKDCAIIGRVPADDIKKLKSIYNNGVTFWRYPANVGRYDLDNSPG